MKYINLLGWTNLRTLYHKNSDKKLFTNLYGEIGEELYNIVKNSKSGLISVYKVSDNPGIEQGKVYSGVTAGFGEGLAVFIDSEDSWFHTSVIQKIDWEKSEFHTLNSTYHFEFEELDDSSINFDDFIANDNKNKE